MQYPECDLPREKQIRHPTVQRTATIINTCSSHYAQTRWGGINKYFHILLVVLNEDIMSVLNQTPGLLLT